LHRIAAHVLGRRRFDVSGHFSLRASPGGISTGQFGADGECVRTAGTVLVREAGGRVSFTPVQGGTLRCLAAFAGADIDMPFSCGDDTPPLGDPDEPVNVVAAHFDVIAAWYQLGWRVLDRTLSTLPFSASPAVPLLWPEHFDIGTDIGLPGGERVNLGCSPGDSHVAEPYLYLGPWGTARPGEPGYWNASFGAVLRASDLTSAGDGAEAGVRFMRTGLDALSGRVLAR
jgi:hypothetical protein